MTTPPRQVFIDAFHNGVDVSMTFKVLSMIYGDKLSIRRTIQRVCKELRNDGDDKDKRKMFKGHKHQRTEENLNEIRKILDEDNRVTLQDICETTGMSMGTVHRAIKEDLGLSLPMLVSLEHLSLVLAITIISERTL